LTEALPYIVVMFVMTLLIQPFVQKCPANGTAKIYSYGFQQISGRYILVMIAYVIYIFFAVFKKIDIDLGATDAYYYMTYYANIPSSLKFYMTVITTFEPGYSLVTWIFRQCTEEYKVMLLFWHTLTFCLTIKFLRNVNLEKYSYLSVFLILLILISQFNTLRMSISITIALIALVYLYEEKWVRSLLVIFIAISMQIAAVIMIPVWIVYFLVTKRKKYPIRQIVVYTIAGIASTIVLLFPVMSMMASSAKNIYLGESSLAIGTYFAVGVIFILSVIKYKEMIALHGFNKVLIVMLPICFVCVPLQYKVAIMYRLTLYFLPVMMALIPSLCQCYYKQKNSVMGIGVIIVLHTYMLYRAYSFFTEEILSIGPYINTLV
jgi:hypothetical protein